MDPGLDVCRGQFPLPPELQAGRRSANSPPARRSVCRNGDEVLLPGPGDLDMAVGGDRRGGEARGLDRSGRVAWSVPRSAGTPSTIRVRSALARTRAPSSGASARGQ